MTTSPSRPAASATRRRADSSSPSGPTPDGQARMGDPRGTEKRAAGRSNRRRSGEKRASSKTTRRRRAGEGGLDPTLRRRAGCLVELWRQRRMWKRLSSTPSPATGRKRSPSRRSRGAPALDDGAALVRHRATPGRRHGECARCTSSRMRSLGFCTDSEHVARTGRRDVARSRWPIDDRALTSRYARSNPSLYRATIRIDNAEFIDSSGRRHRQAAPIVLSAVVGSGAG